MIFVFEDMESDLLSKLFMSAYSKNSFIYANGNGNIINRVTDLLENSGDIIIVYLDTIPDNKDTIDIYSNLKRLSRKNDFRIIVMPIVCAEYYFIKSLPDFSFVSHLGLDVCRNKSYWKDSSLVEDSDRKFTRNFEKFCKLILLKCVKNCIRRSRYDNNLYGFYYTLDCFCSKSEDNCKEINIVDKAISYVKQYPIVPNNNFLGEHNFLSFDDFWEVHRTLVDDFNCMVDTYRKYDSTHSYPKIDYIK